MTLWRAPSAAGDDRESEIISHHHRHHDAQQEHEGTPRNHSTIIVQAPRGWCFQPWAPAFSRLVLWRAPSAAGYDRDSEIIPRHHHHRDAQQEHEARALRLSTTKFAVKVEVSLSKPKVNVKGLEFSFLKHPPATEFVPESRCSDLLKTASPLPLLRLGSWWLTYLILLGGASPLFLIFSCFFLFRFSLLFTFLPYFFTN